MPTGRIPYHWTDALEARFLDALAETGSVRLASRAVGMSAKSAYARREKSADFARRWVATLNHARDVVFDVLTEAAIDGVETRPVRSARNGRLGWRVVDPRLGRGRGLRQLDRLDSALGKAQRKAVSSLPFPENRHFSNWVKQV